ncbi:MAG TPA: hypothetical protein VJN18_11270 [Polyangiaceae bacterium]|nr:hypothetical protein [Polyangiaceae bacterium]
MIAPAPATRIVTPRGKTLAWDDTDRLWLLRAIEAEGEPRDLVAQTLVNRWAWLWDETPGKYIKLVELVRAYAQPVNPAWYPDGKLFLGQLAKLPEAQRAQAVLRANARRDVHSTRTQFSPRTVVAVDTALRGPVSIPPGALHFAATSIDRPDLPVLVPAESDRHNVIYGEAGSRGARARYVVRSATAEPPPPAPSSSSTAARIAAVVGIVALGIGVGIGAAHLK